MAKVRVLLVSGLLGLISCKGPQIAASKSPGTGVETETQDNPGENPQNAIEGSREAALKYLQAMVSGLAEKDQQSPAGRFAGAAQQGVITVYCYHTQPLMNAQGIVEALERRVSFQLKVTSEKDKFGFQSNGGHELEAVLYPNTEEDRLGISLDLGLEQQEVSQKDGQYFPWLQYVRSHYGELCPSEKQKAPQTSVQFAGPANP